MDQGTRMRTRWALVGLTALAVVGLAACGGGGGGGVVERIFDELGLGFDESGEDGFLAVPGNDVRLVFASGNGRLPERVDLRDHLPPVDSQMYAGSCVGWSVGYYLKSALEDAETQGATSGPFSPAFLYNQRPRRDQVGINTDPDGTRPGMLATEALDILVNMGCCFWNTMVYDDNDSHTQPSQAAVAEAAQFRAREYRRFGEFRDLSSTAIGEMRAWLANEGTPITTAIEWWGSMAEYEGENNGVILDAKTGAQPGAHMITIVAYDDNVPSVGTGSFLLCNSHGLEWGNDGFGWLPYEQFKSIFYEAYGVTDLPNNAPPPPAPNGEGNDVIGDAQVIAPGLDFGQVGNKSADPADWWKFTAAARDTATISLTGLTSDVDLKLTDQDEERLADSARLNASDESITYTFPNAGTYYVKVYPWDDQVSPYTLSLSLAASGDPNDVSSGATSILAYATDYFGAVGSGDPRDWWKVSLLPSSQVTVTLTGLTADVDLYVYREGDLGGDFWLRSWNGGTSSEEITFVTASSTATYYFLIVPYASATSNYTLRLDDSADPNLKTESWSVTYTEFSDRLEVTVNSLKVANVGNADSGAFKVRVGLSTDNSAIPGSSFRAGSKQWEDTDGLRAGFTDTWTSGTGTVSKVGLAAGSYYLLFEADADRVIGEPNELDNFAFGSDTAVTIP